MLRNDLDLQYLHSLMTQLIVCINQLPGHRLLYFLKNPVFTFFYQTPWVTKFDIAVKKLKVNPGSSFEQTNGLESQMLHTKFQGNRSTGSREDFWRVFTIYGRGGHLDHVTQMPRTNIRPPYPRTLHIKFGFGPASGFREEDIWNCERHTTDDGRRSMGWL